MRVFGLVSNLWNEREQEEEEGRSRQPSKAGSSMALLQVLKMGWERRRPWRSEIPHQ